MAALIIIKPRATAHASIPGLLQTFHDEYDALMLELFETRKRLGESERELASMAYQVDAANRTVARLVKERDEARAMIGDGGGANGTTIQTTTTGKEERRRRRRGRVCEKSEECHSAIDFGRDRVDQ